MECMDINKSDFWYALYESKQPITDDYGNLTGESELIFGKPKSFRAYVTATKGETQNRQFGEDLAYDRTIIMDLSAPPIDEYSILWIETTPRLDREGNLVSDEDGHPVTPHDYIVKKAARGINFITLAISKVIVG